MPAAVVRLDLTDERLEVTTAPLRARHEQPCPRPQVHRPDDPTPGIAAAQPDLGDFAALRPRGAPRREQQQVGLVLGQPDAAPRPVPDLPADAALFARARGPGPGRSGAASRRSPAGAGPGEEGLRTPVAPWRSPGPRGLGAPSNWRAESRGPGARRQGAPPASAPGPHPAWDDAPCLPRP